jgi:hypothetical protein
VTVAAAKGSYPGMLATRSYQLLLAGDWPPSSVEVSGTTLNYNAQEGSQGWRFEGNTLTTVITAPASPVNQELKIVVHRSGDLERRRTELDDFAGIMTRLREAYDALNQTWPIGWSPDELVDAMQTGDRLSYRPDLAGEQITHLHELLPRLPSAIDTLERQLGEEARKQLAERLKTEYKSKQEQNVASNYKQKLARARAVIADVSGR